MYEMYYLLSGLTIKEIMTFNPVVTAEALDTVEKVALLMLDKGFGGFSLLCWADDELCGSLIN